jgi:alkylation response protein AidB-like acyl-CoA dehydrogenase
MQLEYTEAQEQLRAEIRGTLEQVMTAERADAIKDRVEGGPQVRECVRALAAANLLGLGWPKEYGGRGFSAIEQFIFAEEARRVNAPIPLVTLNTVGPTLMQCGTEEQKQKFLPAILDGSVEFAIGYSEPGAGSDLASVRTTAVRDGSGPDAEYVINGQKMFTSGAAYADYIWLAVRTDPNAKKHKGISILIVPTSSRGFSWQPLHTMPGISTFYTFYDDVRVPASALVGGENQGWQLITTQLNFERAALGNLGALEPLFEKTLEWARTTELDEGRVIDQPWVQLTLARVEAQVAAYKLVNMRVNAAMTKGGASTGLDMGQASAAKVFGTELTQQVARQLLEVLDHNGLRRGDDAPLRGALESAYRFAVINTFGGGANEIQRDIIAMAGLGMPRAPRDLRAAPHEQDKSGGSTT